MKFQRDKLYADVRRTLGTFRFPELEEMIDVLLPELLSIPDILKKLKKAKQKLSGKTFAEMAMMDLMDMSDEDLLRLSHCIHLFDKAYHSKKTKWTCIELLDRTDNRLNSESSIDSVTKAIIQSIRINEQNAFVEVMKHSDGIFYFLIREKKIVKGKGISLRSPIYCACDLDEPYLFFSPKAAVGNPILLRVPPSFGYEDSKVCQLDGKNIKAMTRILKNRAKHHTLHEFNPVDVVRTADGLNYCLDEERKKYAAKIFGGDEPVELECLSVTASVPYRGLRMVPDAEGNMFKASIRVSAPSISDFIQDFAKNRAVTTPLPTWLSKVPYLGKNSFVISEKNK